METKEKTAKIIPYKINGLSVQGRKVGIKNYVTYWEGNKRQFSLIQSDKNTFSLHVKSIDENGKINLQKMHLTQTSLVMLMMATDIVKEKFNLNFTEQNQLIKDETMKMFVEQN